MGVIDKKLNRRAVLAFGALDLLILIHAAFALLVEFDQKQRLILNGGEQVVLPDEVKHMRSTEAKEVW